MAYTGHGHYIPGSVPLPGPGPTDVSKCGGVVNCPRCRKDMLDFEGPYITTDSGVQAEPLTQRVGLPIVEVEAKKKLIAYLESKFLLHFDQSAFEIYIVTLTKTLQHWKAVMVTDMPDTKLYELVYDGDKKQTYVNEYDKICSTIVKD